MSAVDEFIDCCQRLEALAPLVEAELQSGEVEKAQMHALCNRVQALKGVLATGGLPLTPISQLPSPDRANSQLPSSNSHA